MVVIEIVIFVIIIHVREVHRASNDTVFSYYRIITVLLSLFQLLKKRLLFGGQLLAIEQIRKVPATASTVPHVLVCPLYSRGSLHQLFDSFLDLIFNIIIYFGSRWCPLWGRQAGNQFKPLLVRRCRLQSRLNLFLVSLHGLLPLVLVLLSEKELDVCAHGLKGKVSLLALSDDVVLFNFLQDLLLLPQWSVHLLEGKALEVKLEKVSQALILFLQLIYDSIILHKLGCVLLPRGP